jgi:hypothetical protein
MIWILDAVAVGLDWISSPSIAKHLAYALTGKPFSFSSDSLFIFHRYLPFDDWIGGGNWRAFRHSHSHSTFRRPLSRQAGENRLPHQASNHDHK